MPEYHAVDQGLTYDRRGRFTKAKIIGQRDGPRSHGEDVAQNSTYASGRTLIGLDKTGVIVTFHFKRHALALA